MLFYFVIGKEVDGNVNGIDVNQQRKYLIVGMGGAEFN
jgi:hypothetical protein